MCIVTLLYLNDWIYLPSCDLTNSPSMNFVSLKIQLYIIIEFLNRYMLVICYSNSSLVCYLLTNFMRVLVQRLIPVNKLTFVIKLVVDRETGKFYFISIPVDQLCYISKSRKAQWMDCRCRLGYSFTASEDIGSWGRLGY